MEVSEWWLTEVHGGWCHETTDYCEQPNNVMIHNHKWFAVNFFLSIPVIDGSCTLTISTSDGAYRLAPVIDHIDWKWLQVTASNHFIPPFITTNHYVQCLSSIVNQFFSTFLITRTSTLHSHLNIHAQSRTYLIISQLWILQIGFQLVDHITISC